MITYQGIRPSPCDNLIGNVHAVLVTKQGSRQNVSTPELIFGVRAETTCSQAHYQARKASYSQGTQ